jgi:hypothetical protein
MMAIYDLHKELNKFYEDHVRLDADQRKKLAGYRDASLERVTTGLKLLGEERKTSYKSYTKSIGQGSYTMHTLNQHPNDEYDIDEALIFAKDDLPAKAADARQLIADALVKAGGNFRKEPEARTNAVTVWYADGAHVDFAIYREVQGILGSKLEHAGPDWGKRDPEAVTKWFKEQVSEKSPSLLITVEKDQLRRIVRWIKAFARSRLSWSLPGGMILTVLTVETYKLDRNRDDVSLYKTLRALKTRLASSLDAISPIDSSVNLTVKPAIKKQMELLVEKLDKALTYLAILEKDDCTRKQALVAWGKFFNHDFWGEVAEAEGPADEVSKAGVAEIDLAVTIAHAEGAKGSPYSSAERAIAKGRWIGFTVPPAWRTLPNVTYRWQVKNAGDEARSVGDLGHVRLGRADAWRKARYKGVHSMTCEILRGDTVIARGVRRVQVARW